MGIDIAVGPLASRVVRLSAEVIDTLLDPARHRPALAEAIEQSRSLDCPAMVFG